MWLVKAKISDYNVFRQTIYEKQVDELKQLMLGEIEIDESYFGPKRVKEARTRHAPATGLWGL